LKSFRPWHADGRKYAKYEGKIASDESSIVVTAVDAIVFCRRCSRGALVAVILGVKNFVKLFTSYSHHCPSALPAA
jgi:hypothetical protein